MPTKTLPSFVMNLARLPITPSKGCFSADSSFPSINYNITTTIIQHQHRQHVPLFVPITLHIFLTLYQGPLCICIQQQISMKVAVLLVCLLTLAQVSHSFDFTSQELTDKALSFIDLVLGRGKNLGNDSCTKSCCASLPSRGALTYHYYQNTGRFVGGSGEYAINTHGYSGQGEGYNNPAKQCVVNTGPLPATTYKLASCVNVMHETVDRPCAFYLQPQKPNEMCGRNAFFVHGCACCTPGDDTNPPTAGCSAGCIVLSYANRRKLRVGDTLIVEHFQPKQLPFGILSQ